MEGVQANGICGLQGFRCSDGRTVCQSLALKCMLAQRVAIDHLRSAVFAQFGQNDGAFRIQRGRRNAWVTDHTRYDFYRLVQLFGRRVGQIELVYGLGRCRLGVAVTAKGYTEPLPNSLCFPIGHKGRTAERQMLDEMGKALLVIIFMQCARINPDADRHLPCRNIILLYGITKPIGQNAKSPRVVNGNVAAFIQPRLRKWLRHFGRN